MSKKNQDNKTPGDFAFPKTWAVFAAPEADVDVTALAAVPEELAGPAGRGGRRSTRTTASRRGCWPGAT